MGAKATNARVAKRYAIRTSVNAMEAIAKEDNPLRYDNIVKTGREQLTADRQAAVPVEDDA